MTVSKKALFLIVTLFFPAALTGFAQVTNKDLLGQDRVNTITTAVPFLLIAPDARGGAMGDAGVAGFADVNSFHYNPAKYAFIDNDMGFAVSYSPWLRALVNDISLGYLAGYRKIDDMSAVAAELRYFSLGDITFTDKIGNTIGQFTPNEFSVAGTYARKFSDNISGAVSLRYIYSNLTGGIFVGGAESRPGQSVSTDVSVYYRKPLDIRGEDGIFSFGANFSNIGAKISYTETTQRDFIPMNLRMGPALSFDIDNYNSISILVDFNKLLVPSPPIYARDSVTGLPIPTNDGKYQIASGKDPDVGIVSGMFGSFTDAPGGFQEEFREIALAAGVEYWYDKQFALRGGVFLEDKTKGGRKYFTLGAGLKYNVFALDFAYLIPMEQRNPLENTLRFTLVFDFEALRKQKEL